MPESIPTYPHDCEHPRSQHLGSEGVCQTSGCLCVAADYYLHQDRPVATVERMRCNDYGTINGEDVKCLLPIGHDGNHEHLNLWWPPETVDA
jgi:hypothetical protein